VADFVPRRSQRRCWQGNQGELRVRAAAPGYSQEQYDLYCRYQASRHSGGSMDGVTPETYLGFLESPWADTRFFEFRLAGRLVAVAVTDLLPRGLSAMYTFYEPELPKRGLGVYSVLWQIEYARSLGLPWLYLGYWIAECQKMSYKDYYRPVEAWTGVHWQRFGPGQPIQA
jgi:arginine-tRNA-protein transferase